VTFAGNRARTAGGAVYAQDAAGLRIEGAVLWGDEAPQGPEVHVASGAPPVVSHAVVAGGYPGGTGVLDQDPLFVRAPSPGPDDRWGTEDDDYGDLDYGDLRLREGSPALDAGLAALLPPDAWDLDGDGDMGEPLPVDVAGRPRVVGAEVDLGAHEGVAVVAVEPGPAPDKQPVSLSVYPNPSRGDAEVTLTLQAPSRVEVSLYDALGRRVVILTNGAFAPGSHTLSLQRTPSPAGLYVVRAVTEEGHSAAVTLTLVR
jgi:predicted outer membrane repeat protein